MQPPPLAAVPGLLVAAPALPPLRVLLAKYKRAQRRHAPIWIVIHCTAGAEGKGKAWDGAHELHNCPPTRKRSAHYFVDSAEVVQCVAPNSEAWHAGKHANVYGIGIELCGRATQTRAQWLDGDSLPTLRLAARLVHELCATYQIPKVLLSGDQLQRVLPGITTHAAVSAAFPAETDHTDPGPHFPLEEFVAAVKGCDPLFAV